MIMFCNKNKFFVSTLKPALNSQSWKDPRMAT